MKTILAWTLLLASACAAAAGGNQILLQNLDPAGGTPQLLAADHSGHLFLISTLSSASGQQVTRVVKLDLNGSRLASLDVPQLASAAAAVTDAQDNLVLAGQNGAYQGVVLKLDAQLRSTLFSQSLPGIIQAAAVDKSGNVYVTGGTGSATFPLTAGAYQTKPPGSGPFGGATYGATYAFLTEISAAGDRLLYSTYFGDDATHCYGGSACIGAWGYTSGTAIGVDPSGGVVIAGSTSAYNLPATPGALAGTCACQYRADAGFVAKFQPAASQQLQWSTFLNSGYVPYESVTVNSLDLDAAGNVFLAGSAPTGLPTTPGTIQPSVSDTGGFVMKLNSLGSAVVWGTYFDDRVKVVHADAQGGALITGTRVNPSPLPVPGYGFPFVARLSAGGTGVAEYYEGPVGNSLVVTSTGVFAALGQALWIETANPGPSLLSIVNSASGAYSSAVTPVELITLYGVGLGPQTPARGQVEKGVFSTSLAGCQVLFDGAAAPLLYADSGQINAVVPRSVIKPAHVQVVTASGTTIDGPAVQVSYPNAPPGIFQNSQTGMAAAVNQDGTVNSFANAARPGSIVAVFVAGAGANYFADGAIVPLQIYTYPGPVYALTGSRSMEVDFAGDAPGMVAGVMQINFRVPDSQPVAGILDFWLEIAGVNSPESRIAVGP
jgi:uncharacterized protein (TIGR03437 family)